MPREKKVKSGSVKAKIKTMIEAKTWNTGTPLSAFNICTLAQITLKEYNAWREKEFASELAMILDNIIYNSLYAWGFSEKIKSPKVLEIFVERELPSDNSTQLVIENDINDIEKVVSAFNINNPKEDIPGINIDNPRDEIVKIESDDLVELIGEPDA